MADSTVPENLIIVCCHGIWKGGPSHGVDESEWLIADFQRGETGTFAQHAEAGIRCLAESPNNSILVFSGGPTREETQLSEAESYYNLSQAQNYWNNLTSPPVLGKDVLLETRALDSYHNILYSLTLFWNTFGAWPTRLTIVSHAFKKPRIVDGHCVAIGFPLDRVTYIGIDPPSMAPGGEKRDVMMASGVTLAKGEWEDDPHGRGSSLAGKRKRRNPWSVWQGIFEKGVEANKSGLITTGNDADEQLDFDAIRPWVGNSTS